MSDENLQAIALFFFFAFLDEKTALDAATKTSLKFRSRLAKMGKTEPEEVQALIVDLTRKFYAGFRHRHAKIQSTISGEEGWELPRGVELAPWRQFKKESPENDFLTLIWSKILGFPDEVIAAGLGVTPGTVRYRIGNGLRALGAMCKFRTLTKA